MQLMQNMTAKKLIRSVLSPSQVEQDGQSELGLPPPSPASPFPTLPPMMSNQTNAAFIENLAEDLKDTASVAAHGAVTVYSIMYPIVTTYLIMNLAWEYAMRQELYYLFLHYKARSPSLNVRDCSIPGNAWSLCLVIIIIGEHESRFSVPFQVIIDFENWAFKDRRFTGRKYASFFPYWIIGGGECHSSCIQPDDDHADDALKAHG